MAQSAFIVLFVYWLLGSLDYLMSWQTLTRPIVVGPIIGLALGDMRTGIIMGASLESVFMGISAIGGSIPSDPFTSTLISVAYIILTGADIEAGLAIAMPIGTIMMSVGQIAMPFLSSLAPYWENLAHKGDMKKFRIQYIACGFFLDRLLQCIVLFLAVTYGIGGLQTFLGNMPEWFMRGLGAASGMMIGVGLSILTSMIWSKEVGGFFFIGFVLAKYLGMDVVSIAIIAAVVAIMYFYNEKKLLDIKTSIQNSTNGSNSDSEEDDFF